MNWAALIKNVRFWVLVCTVVLALGIYLTVARLVPEGSLRTIRLVEVYALTALTYLYVALLIGPAVYVFKWLPHRGYIHRARRAIGFSAWCFACLHAYLAFFSLLGGFPGLFFLNPTFLLAITFSIIALIILTLMAATSFDVMVRTLGRRWKLLHRFVYLAGMLILIHAMMLGSHFTDLGALIPQIMFILVGFLLLLQANRFDAYLVRRFRWPAHHRISFVVVVVVIALYIGATFFPEVVPGLNIHGKHLQLIQ
jgi:DMSO/TMAO reductase YedYZ heme-binding membrane subunit